MKKAVYKRVIIKLSGEALAGDNGNGINEKVLDEITDQIIAVKNLGVEIGIIVGGGNFWRGRQGKEMDRTTADHMGMLATIINALGLQDALERKGVPTRVQTALTITRVAEPYILRKALSHLNKGRVVIFACGTGNPYFTTDTGAALRAAEINAEVLLLAKNVDGIYDSDPKLNPNAKKLDEVSYKDYITQGLKAMDTTAITICMENNIHVLSFGLFEENALLRAVTGEKIGTLIKQFFSFQTVEKSTRNTAQYCVKPLVKMYTLAFGLCLILLAFGLSFLFNLCRYKNYNNPYILRDTRKTC